MNLTEISELQNISVDYGKGEFIGSFLSELLNQMTNRATDDAILDDVVKRRKYHCWYFRHFFCPFMGKLGTFRGEIRLAIQMSLI